MDKQQIMQIVLAVISVISAIGTGYLSFKTNKDKKDIVLLEADGKFRADLIARLNDLQEQVKRLENENTSLRQKVFELQKVVADQLDTVSILGSFCRHIPAPVWVKKIDESGKMPMYFINKKYEELFDVTYEFYVGKEDHDVWGPDIAEHFAIADNKVIRMKKGEIFIENVPVDPFNPEKGIRKCVIWKFPVLEDQKVVGIGGIMIDIDEYLSSHAA